MGALLLDSHGGIRTRGVVAIHAPAENQPNTPKTPPKELFIAAHYHKSLLMGAPPVFTSLLHRSGISAMRARISSIVIAAHSCHTTSLNSSSVLHVLCLTLFFNMLQTPSVGLQSGDYGG